MKIFTRTAAAAMLVSMPIALSACGGSGGGSKPSKDEVKAGYVKAIKKEGGSMASSVPDATFNKLADCIFDKSYDKVSAKTLNAIKSGNTSEKIDSKDEKTLTDATDSCKSTVTAR
ncbi:hypothetical protein HJ588_12655 [Flexivirga sp. ID2601S]|uniref:Lipoprotein n=1 Tax=Flexivirga aerilata TaxID=1656889 RepID=A0A849AGZ3_9MICO|nr:hypothetical protein [Flexivirga aerilata]NNG40114.1 hypothetical protein [Flexivirga aerilata]